MWLRTKTTPAWYVHEIRGACYISWVSAADKTNAQIFPEDNIEKWIEVLSKMSRIDLESEAMIRCPICHCSNMELLSYQIPNPRTTSSYNESCVDPIAIYRCKECGGEFDVLPKPF